MRCIHGLEIDPAFPCFDLDGEDIADPSEGEEE